LYSKFSVCNPFYFLSFILMSYLVLARKWRPQTFEDVVGQEHVTRTLQNSLKEDHLAHALLFSGPRGVGKTSIARILAKAMNCEQGPSPIPCNKCGICKEITDGTAVDVLEIDGASNRGIDEIRQLRETIRFQPVRCRYRVFIIDEVHMLTKEAFNALLKTLEEPPPHVFFIFATTEPHRIPATIHSRCQHYEFRRIETARLADHLDTIVKSEGMELPREATLLLAREAEGSVRDSLSLLDQVAAYGATCLEDVHEALGVIGTSVMSRLAYAIMEGDVQTSLSISADVYRLGIDFQKFINDLILFFRNLLILKKTSREKGHLLVELDDAEARELDKKFRNFSAHSILNVLNVLMKGQSNISTSSTPRLSLELLLIRLCGMQEVVSVDELLQDIKAVVEQVPFNPPTSGRSVSGTPSIREPEQNPARTYGARSGAGKREDLSQGRNGLSKSALCSTAGNEGQQDDVPRATGKGHGLTDSSTHDTASRHSAKSPVHDKTGKATQTESSGPSVRHTEHEKSDDEQEHAGQTHKEIRQLDKESWKDFIRFVSGKKPSLATVLSSSKVDIKKDTVTLRCGQGLHQEMLSDSDYSSALAEMGLQFFGSPVKIRVAKSDSQVTSKASLPKGAEDRRQELIQTPLVQEAMRSFGARISSLRLYHDRRRG